MLLLPSLGSVVIYTQFKLAQDDIAQTICIQRANINNSCNGRCELQKSLKKFDDNERKMNNTNLKEKTELVYTTAPFGFNIITSNIPQKKETTFSDFCEKPKRISFTIFHPPLV